MIAFKFYCSHTTYEAISEVVRMAFNHAEYVKIVVLNQSVVSILARVFHFEGLLKSHKQVIVVDVMSVHGRTSVGFCQSCR